MSPMTILVLWYKIHNILTAQPRNRIHFYTCMYQKHRCDFCMEIQQTAQVVIAITLLIFLCNMAENNVNLKALIQEAVQEALQKEASTKAKSRPKKSSDVQSLDATRGMGIQIQDPRANPDQWPCYANHIPWKASNRFGEWTDCQRCALRMAYVPRKGASGQSTKMDLPSNVVAALEQLRVEGMKPEDVDHFLVKKTIRMIVAQEAMKVAKKGQAKTKAGPRPTAPYPGTNPENIQIHSEDEELHQVVEEQVNGASRKSRAKSSTTPTEG